MGTTDAVPVTSFAGLTIRHGPTVLEPRPWTVLQSEWAAELSSTLPPGPVLELCSGAGHIGLLAALRCGRELVQIDANPSACADARYNAASAGLADRVVVHCASIAEVATWTRRFPLIIADPPYIASREVTRYEQDPVDAIDGGMDGLDLARACADAVIAVLAPHGRALLQLGGRRQVDAMEAWAQPDLDLVEIRSDGPDRYVALFERAGDQTV